MTPLLLVGHGDVAGGFIEPSAPPLTDAVAELYAAGHRHVAAVPLVLVAAGHAKGDMPAALNRERERHPGLGCSYGRPLGLPVGFAGAAESKSALRDSGLPAVNALLHHLAADGGDE